ncbi:MAG: acetyl-CoA acetyltransferase [Deltaproteobacteria bacterium]|nr:acetyl-CoA acetyltransferase [Deltaproteobacteria bacterium]
MSNSVAIVGVGYTPTRKLTPEVSYKEMIYEACVRAYHDANLASHRDIDGFISCAEDFLEGTSIFDEYTPDQLGGIQKPMHTISGDTLLGLATAVMNIRTGLQQLVVVEAHSKASNIKTLDAILHYATDPILTRPLHLNPHFIAGLEMQRFLDISKNTLEQCAEVVVKNKRNALKNDLSTYGTRLTTREVLSSEPTSTPLTQLQHAEPTDGAIVFVLASSKIAKKMNRTPVWIKGCGWISDAPSLETRDWNRCAYAALSAQMAYRQAGIRNPKKQIDFFEIDDTFSYKELEHLEALGIYETGKSGKALLQGALDPDGKTPTNVSGGSLGMGHVLEATGGFRTLEIVKQLRAEAGPRQLDKVKTGLAFSWRGLPTTSGVTMIYSQKGA